MKKPKYGTVEEWKERIQAWRNSGLPATRWCQQHNVPYTVLWYWRNKIEITPHGENTEIKALFVELNDPESIAKLEVEYKGVKIRLCKGFDAASLQSCLEAIGGMKC